MDFLQRSLAFVILLPSAKTWYSWHTMKSSLNRSSHALGVKCERERLCRWVICLFARPLPKQKPIIDNWTESHGKNTNVECSHNMKLLDMLLLFVVGVDVYFVVVVFPKKPIRSHWIQLVRFAWVQVDSTIQWLFYTNRQAIITFTVNNRFCSTYV